MKKYLVFSFIFLMPLFALAEGFGRDLQFGMKNNSDVIKLQELLTNEGLYSGPISGNYFSLTQKAVKNFQVREGIKPASGYFGSKTRTKANTIFAFGISASKDDVSIKSIVIPSPVVPAIPVKIENNKSDEINSMMDQIAALQKQIDSLLKKTAPVSPAQTTVAPNQTPVVAQPSSVSVLATPVQAYPVISSSPQSISVQATGDGTASATINTQTSGGSFKVIGPNGIDYGTGGVLQSY